MPKKIVKKTTRKTVKKSMVKREPARRASRVLVRPAAASMNDSTLSKRYLHSETEDFYAQHPNAKPLLILFILLAISAFIYLVKVRYAMM